MFEKGSKERNRAMQGQSPYLINAGIFYQDAATGGRPPFSTTASANASSA